MLLSKTKEKYEKAFGASERALDAYRRADDDLNLSRAEVFTTFFENYSKILILASEVSDVYFLKNLSKCFFDLWKFFSILRFYSLKSIGKNL